MKRDGDYMSTKHAKRKALTILGSLVILHLAITIPFSYFLNIWSDEASTLYTTQSGVIAAVANAANEKQAPFYFILLSGWRLIDDSILFARLFSVLCAAASIPVVFLLVRRIWSEKAAYFAAFFFAAHPYLIWAATEIRVYALMILTTALLLLFFERGFLDYRKQNLRWRHGLTILAVAAFYTNYYLGFLLVALLVSLLVVRRYKSALDYLARMAVVLVAVAPLLYFAGRSAGGDLDGLVLAHDPVDALRYLWNHVLTFLLPTELFPPENQTALSFVRLWIVRAGIVVTLIAFVLQKRLPGNRSLVFGSQAAVILLFLFAAYFVLGKLYVEVRHAAVLFVPFFLCVFAIILELAPKRHRFRYFAPFALLFLVFYSYGVTVVHPNLTKRGDWARVVKFVQENERPGQPIVVFRTYEVLAFRQYYTGANKVHPDSGYFRWNYEGELGTAEMWPRQQEWVVSQIPSEAVGLWLVTEEVCHTTDACLSLEKHVKENYTVEIQKDFYKERVRLLKKKK